MEVPVLQLHAHHSACMQLKTRITIGIGRASAIALGKAGWAVVISGRSEAQLQETAKQIEKSHYVVGDLVSRLLRKGIARRGFS